MKLPTSEKKILMYFKNEYIEAHGTTQSNLDKFTIFLLDEGLKAVVPHLYGSDPKLTELKSIFKELESRKLMKIHGNNRDYSITEKGLALASQGNFDKAIEYFNTNPGWAVLISVVSLLISAVALFKQTPQ